ncbi:MAG: hypothetical protein KDI98_03995 [Hyphomicrobiaceae bacterium]|nr:hypothetical protein [Hyphomicrobiaceae bacterium]
MSVSPSVGADLRRWLRPDGTLRPDAPQGAERFLRDLSVNRALAARLCLS